MQQQKQKVAAGLFRKRRLRDYRNSEMNRIDDREVAGASSSTEPQAVIDQFISISNTSLLDEEKSASDATLTPEQKELQFVAKRRRLESITKEFSSTLDAIDAALGRHPAASEARRKTSVEHSMPEATKRLEEKEDAPADVDVTLARIWEKITLSLPRSVSVTLQTRDIVSYFRGFSPLQVEWIDDVSCNVVFPSRQHSFAAIESLSRKPSAKDLEQTERRLKASCMDSEEFKDIRCNLEKLPWRKFIGINMRTDRTGLIPAGYPESPPKNVWIRIATGIDRKLPINQRKPSEWKMKEGSLYEA